MHDLLIRGGQVVLPSATVEADVAITGHTIAAVGMPGSLGTGKRVVDARGLHVLPGGVDPHVHLRWPAPPEALEGVHPNTVAAACGGTTTVLDFVIQGQAVSLRDSIRKRQAQAEGHMAVDYGFHSLITCATPEIVREMREVVQSGVSSFKVMTAYRKLNWMLDDGSLYAVMAEASRWRALVCLHAENEDLLLNITAGLLSEGKTGVEHYEAGRPVVVEAEAVRRGLYLARKSGATLYVVHVSSREGLEAIREARAQGQAVFAETCPHYLTFTDEVYCRPRARLFAVIPPIRSESDRQALWAGVQDGALACIGSDDAVRTVAEKQTGDTFDQIPMGLPGVETRLPVLYSEGVSKGRITVNRLAELVSTGPARLFGLYPRKGLIAPGSDADLVLVDPAVRKTIRLEDLHLPNDYTTYEGWNLQGYPSMSILRGRVIVENGDMVEATPSGQFVPRAPFHLRG